MAVVWVHGVSVRQKRFNSLLEKVRTGIGEHQRNLKVEGFYWGDSGASLRYGGASIPDFLQGTRAIFDGTTLQSLPADPNAIAALLVEEPLLELISIKDEQEFGVQGVGFMPTPPEVKTRNQLLAEKSSNVAALLHDHPLLSASLDRRIPSNQISAVVAEAFTLASQADRSLDIPDLKGPLTRAITARLYNEGARGDPLLDTPVSWSGIEIRVHVAIEQELGGQMNVITDKVKDIALPAATWILRNGLRQKIMGAMALFVGDVLVYQSNREAMLAGLEKKIAEASRDGEPLWLLGHSLGGIMCLDYCSTTWRHVDRLITVGCQVGLFGELGALKGDVNGQDGLEVGQIPPCQTPDAVGHWLNIYDLNDMLSFRAAPVFSRVTDIVIDTKAPFPASHSEYWDQDDVYRHITSALQA